MRRHFSKSIVRLAFFLAMALQSCASIQPPPGGPEDKSPPKILESSPKERELNVPRESRIHFLFADPIDKNSFLTAFSITPYVTGKIKYKWSGSDEVVVQLPEQLRENTTYSISLSRDLKTRRGNALKTPVHLTFSTGVAIDTGKLDGFLSPAIASTDPLKSSEIFIFAYDLSAHRADTLTFTHTRPDLMTQADDKGAFEFLAMKRSVQYRIFAVQDVFRTGLYDPGVDSYGLPTGDAVLDSNVVTDFRVRMATQVDTVKPELEDAESIDKYHLRVKFSKAIDTLSVSPQNFTLTHLLDKREHTLLAAFRDRPEKHANEMILLLGEPLEENGEQELKGMRSAIHDVAHNPLSDSAYTVRFTPIAAQDTFLAPKIASISILDSMRDIPVKSHIQIAWTDAVREMPLDSSVQLFDTSKKQVPLVFHWVDHARFTAEPRDSLHPLEFYTLKVFTSRFRSPEEAAARQQKDTLILVRFQTEDFRDDGKLSGDILVADSLWTKYPGAYAVVQLLDASGVRQQERRLAPHTTHYEFERVLKGSYRVRGYLVRQGEFAFDPGSIIPFRFAMPSGDYSTAIDIRQRWSTERVDFQLK